MTVSEMLERLNGVEQRKNQRINWHCPACLEFRDQHVQSRLSKTVWHNWQIHLRTHQPTKGETNG